MTGRTRPANGPSLTRDVLAMRRLLARFGSAGAIPAGSASVVGPAKYSTMSTDIRSTASRRVRAAIEL